MYKRKSLRKSILASALTAAMLASMAMPAFADDNAVHEVTEATAEDTIVLLDKAEPVAPPATAPVSDSSATNSNSSESSNSMAMDEQMKKALNVAKTYFEIDEKVFTEFYYDVYEYDGKSNWRFNWNSQDYSSYIYINVVDGLVTSYSKVVSRDDSNSFSFAKISKTEAEKKASEFLKKIFGDTAKNFKVYSNSLYYNSSSYEISFAVYKGDYMNTSAATPSVSVDKLTGEITSYYYYNEKYNDKSAYNEKNYAYQSSSKIIKSDQAAKAFIEKIGVDLKYSYNFDYSTKELKIFPVYTVSNSGKYISAVTGEVVEIYSNYSGIVRPVAEMAMGANSMSYDSSAKEQRAESINYTQAEVDELDKIKNYISKEKAVETAIGLWGLKKDEVKDYTQSVSLSKNYINQNQYIWNINFSSSDKDKYNYYYATIDARNGTVITYYSYNDDRYSRSDNSDDYKYTYDEAKKIALDEVNKLAKSYGVEKNFEFAEGNVQLTEKEMNYSFTWNRIVNGVKFDSNYINIEFDNYNGKISSYSINWFEDAKFPELKNIISKEKAFDRIVEYSEYFPAYVETKYDEDKQISSMSLAYMLKDYWVNVDPYTGDYLNYSGKPDTSQQEPDYDDIKGHWCEEIVTTLTDNGIYVWGGKFEPDRAITANEFIEYIRFYSNINYNSYSNYERLYKSYILTPDSDSAVSDEKANADVTKQEAAKIICELLGYDRLMKNSEYLLYPFSGDADKEYKGYITIGYMLGVIEGKAKDSYDAEGLLTRAEAAQMLYNLLTK